MIARTITAAAFVLVAGIGTAERRRMVRRLGPRTADLRGRGPGRCPASASSPAPTRPRRKRSRRKGRIAAAARRPTPTPIRTRTARRAERAVCLEARAGLRFGPSGGVGEMVQPAGLEPATYGSTIRRSTSRATAACLSGARNLES